MQRSKSVALMFLLGTLLVGGALGFTADRMVAGSRPCDRASLRQELATKLALTDAQRTSVDSILEWRHQEMSATMAPIRPRMDSIRNRARAEIARLLDPGQQVKFQELLRESEAKRQRKEGGTR